MTIRFSPGDKVYSIRTGEIVFGWVEQASITKDRTMYYVKLPGNRSTYWDEKTVYGSYQEAMIKLNSY